MTEKNKIRRFDRAEIQRTHITPEGFLKADAIVTRTGVFLYQNPDGTIRRELRHPDDVLRADSLKTMEMIPITLLHPEDKKVTSSNVRNLACGFTGEKVRVDGKFIINSLVVTDQGAIDAVLNGMQELSLGYDLMLEEEAGEYDNQRFDFRQKDVVYNHLAIVPKARAGSQARIVLDHNDAVQITEEKEQPPKKEKRKMEEKNMVKIALDGIDYETSPEVRNALAKTQARAETAEAQVKTLNDEKTKIQANLDAASDELKALKAKDVGAEIAKAVDARLALIATATPHLDAETVKKLNTMSDAEIKAAVIVKHYPECKLDGKDAVYIQARFDAAIELKVENKEDAAMAEQRKAAAIQHSDSNDQPDQKKARDKMVNEMTGAWKPATK